MCGVPFPAVSVTRSASHIAGDAHNPIGPQLLERLRAICGAAHVLTQPIQSIPGVELVEPAEWELCCGSAGISAHLERKGGPLPLVHPMQLLAQSIEGGTRRRRRPRLPWR